MNRRNLMLGAGATALAAVIPVAAIAEQVCFATSGALPAGFSAKRYAWVKITGRDIANAEIARITRDGDSYAVQFVDGFQARMALQNV